MSDLSSYINVAANTITTNGNIIMASMTQITGDGASPAPSLNDFNSVNAVDITAVGNLSSGLDANIGGNIVVWGSQTGNPSMKLVGTGIVSSSDDSNTIIRTQSSSVAPGGAHTYDFVFDTSGSLNFKEGASNYLTMNRFGITADTQMTISAANSVSGNNSSILFDKNGGGIVLRLETNAPLTKNWKFYQGNVTFPDNSVQTTAFTGTIPVANVSGLGNIATVNKDGNTSNILYGNGAFASSSGIRGQLVADTTLALVQSGTVSVTSSMYRVMFSNAGSVTTCSIILPDTDTCYVGQSFVLASPTINYSYILLAYGSVNVSKSLTAGTAMIATVVAKRSGAAEVAGNWAFAYQSGYGVTGTGLSVFNTSPTMTAPTFNGTVDMGGAGAVLGQTGEKYTSWGYTVAATAITPSAVATGGVFTIPSTNGLSMGQAVTLTGTNTGTGSITGYTSGTTYYIIGFTSNANATSITLSTARNSATAVTTTAGTLVGLSMSAAATVGVTMFGGASLVHVNGTVSANFDVSVNNVYNSGCAYSITLIVNQGATAYIPQNLIIGSYGGYSGATQTISWQGGLTPTGNANKKDVFTFSWLQSGSQAAAIVLGQMVSFG